MLQSEITGDGMDAVASEISLVERSRRCYTHFHSNKVFRGDLIILGNNSHRNASTCSPKKIFDKSMKITNLEILSSICQMVKSSKI